MTNLAAREAQKSPRTFDVILWGGLTAGVLDATDGVIALGFKGMNPIQVLQYIASGALGADAFKGELSTAALGAFFHFLIAFVVAAVYYGASLNLTALYRKPAIWGPAYGAAVYLFMNYLVLPLSAVPKSSFSLALFLNGILGHALFVGLPIAWFAHRSVGKNANVESNLKAYSVA
ncbi:MAG TPA: hypothetical protein VFO39_23445 [Candidatus Sulfotelmatobacter sp.]|nr:hypothetical protein [Candidatus Sulfotelmatobacter sp.]